MSDWYIQVRGTIIGPTSSRELRSLVERGSLELDTLVRHAEEEHWTTLEKLLKTGRLQSNSAQQANAQTFPHPETQAPSSLLASSTSAAGMRTVVQASSRADREGSTQEESSSALTWFQKAAIHNAIMAGLLFLIFNTITNTMMGGSAASRLLAIVDYFDVTIVAISAYGLFCNKSWGMSLTSIWTVLTVLICLTTLLLMSIAPGLFSTGFARNAFDLQTELIMQRFFIQFGILLLLIDAVGTWIEFRKKAPV